MSNNTDPLMAALGAPDPIQAKVESDMDEFDRAINDPIFQAAARQKLRDSGDPEFLSAEADVERRRAAEVDELLERASILREDIEGSADPQPTDPLMRALGDLTGDTASEAVPSLEDALLTPSTDPPLYTEAQLQELHDTVQVLENNFIDRYQTFKTAEADMIRRQEAFNAENAELIALRDTAKKAATDLEGRLKDAAVIYAKASGEKKFDSYVYCKNFLEVAVVDRAAATTWAEVGYPAALNTVLDDKLIEQYLKNLVANKETLPEWATSKEGLRAEVSKKFVGATQTAGE